MLLRLVDSERLDDRSGRRTSLRIRNACASGSPAPRLELPWQPGEGVVERLESPLTRNLEEQELPRGGLPDLDARAVLVGVPVELDLHAAADAVRELVEPAAGQESGGVRRLHPGGRLSHDVHDSPSSRHAAG